MSKKSLFVLSTVLMACAFVDSAMAAAPESAHSQLKIGVVNFKTCLENSKLGKQEIARLEEIQKQLETTIRAKEKEHSEMAEKFNPVYLDTLNPKAEAELKERFSHLSQEISQLQNQSYNLLNQAQYQIVSKLTQMVSQASAVIAKEKGLDLALNEEACPYFAPSLDISALVIGEMDAQFTKEAGAAAAAQAPAPATVK